jgi:uncharacterized protein (TIGR01777 family)
MAESTLVYRSDLPVSAADLYAWHAREGAFDRLTPPWMDVRVRSAMGTIEPGDAKSLRLGMGPISLSWSLVHHAAETEYGFTDEQLAGPFHSWTHAHHFLSTGPESSVLEDRITYELPLSAVTGLLAGRQVKSRIDDLFRFRHRRTMTDLRRHAEAGLIAPLRIAVTGASGMIGRQLVAFLRTGGHDVVSLVRRPPHSADEIFWDPASGKIDAAALEGVDAVIHLAGVSIASGRWSTSRKRAILESRHQGTRLIAETLAGLQNPPRVLVSASGIGFYGDGEQSVLTESSPQGAGFLADVCRIWEQETAPAAAAGIRVVTPRFGVVLSGTGGMLRQLSRLFKLGGGGRLGSGNQYMSWIAIDDLLGVLLEAIANPALEGPINAVAPQAVTNAEFTSTMAKVLRRPAIARGPAPVLRLAAGELADELLLVSQRAAPSRLTEVGFHFDYPTLETALRHEFGRPQVETFPQLAASPSPAYLHTARGD